MAYLNERKKDRKLVGKRLTFPIEVLYLISMNGVFSRIRDLIRDLRELIEIMLLAALKISEDGGR